MKPPILSVAPALLLFLTLIGQPSTASAQGTAFSYQGQLASSGAPANGNYDLQFTLYATNATGVALAGPVTNSATAVSNGLFSTTIDFGPGVFTGASYWLDVAVRTNGGSAFTELTPRQAILQVPYAIMANSASNLLGTVPASQLPSSVLTNGAGGVTITGTFTGNGTGLTNVPGTLTQSVVAGSAVTAQPNTAYDLTDASLVTVTLPASANVGDVVQVDGTGSGEWQVLNDQIWEKSTSSGTTRQDWNGVASSSNGSNLVAVVLGGGIWTSTNSGVTWTKPTSNGTTGQDWDAVASSSSGSNLVAVTDNAGNYNSGIWTSTNSGLTWTESTSSGTSGPDWYSVASSSSGSNLVAVVFGGGIWTSGNSGLTWTESTSNDTTNQEWDAVASSASGSNLVAAPAAGGIWTSTNSGVTWTESSGPTYYQTFFSVASSASGSNLVAVVLGGGIWTSTDSGVTWTESTSSGTINQYWYSVASSASGSNLVAVAADDGIWTSTDSGVTWMESTTSGTTNQVWYSVASSASGSNLVAVVFGGGIWTLSKVFTGLAGSSQEFVYLGNDVWQPLTPSLGDSGQALTNLNASQLTSGTVPLAQLPAAVVTNNETGVILSGTFSGNGSGLTNLNASQLTSGVISTNVLPGFQSPNYNTVGGGYENLAGGEYSFAAGQQAEALSQGDFVWADSQNAPFASTANDQFLIRAQGGVGINMNANPAAPQTAALYAQGGNNNTWQNSVVWFLNTNSVSAAPALRVANTSSTATSVDGALSVSANGKGLIAEFGNASAYVVVITNNGTIYALAFDTTSDRNAKEHFSEIDPQAVLAKVAALPITQWNFKADTGTRHIGPMAQDFYNAFNVGTDDRHIATVDEDGVALAAIQGLNEKVDELKTELNRRDVENNQLKQRNGALAKQLDELEAAVKSLEEKSGSGK